MFGTDDVLDDDALGLDAVALPAGEALDPLGALPTADELLGLDEVRLAPGDPDAYFQRADSLLEDARRCHGAMGGFRRKRASMLRHLASLQWGVYTDPTTGEEIDEAEDLRDQGLLPASNNRLRPLLRHVKGRLRENASERTPFAVENDDKERVAVMAEALRAVRRDQGSRGLDAYGIAELATSGLYVRRAEETWDDDTDRFEIADDAPHPTRFFFDVAGASDHRLKGVTLIGEVLDAHPDELIAAFAETEDQAAAIRAIYTGGPDQFAQTAGMDSFDTGHDSSLYDAKLGDFAGYDRHDGLSFEVADAVGRWRCVRVWRKEGRWSPTYHDGATGLELRQSDLAQLIEADGGEATPEAIAAEVADDNAVRMQMGVPEIETGRRFDRVWVRYTLSPTAHVLARDEDPYGGRHGYTVALADFVDGEVRGFFDDLIDPQRQINRVFAQVDALISAGAKGMWAVPVEAMPAGMEKEEFAAEFNKVGNIFFYSLERLKAYGPNASNLIKSIEPVAIPAALIQHLQLLTESLDKVGGLSDAALGRAPSAGTPAALYTQMIASSSTQQLDLFETFFDALSEHDGNIVRLVCQFWDDVRPVRSAGTQEGQMFDPELVRDFTWFVSVGRTSETALYRQLFEQDLKDLLTAQRLTLPQFLQESSHPRAQALLHLVQVTNPLLQQGADPAAAQQFMAAAQAGDPDAVAILRQAQEFGGAAQAAAPMPTPPM